MDVGQVALLLGAGLAGGTVNALAGGGSLITYPALLLAGIPPVAANVTNALSVAPGYFASVVGSRAELTGQRRRALWLIPTAIIGAGLGTLLLLTTPAAAFEAIVPYLIIFAALLMALGPRISKLVGHPSNMSPRARLVALHIMTGLATMYGGYFNAALGLVLVAGLALVMDEKLARVGALKNAMTGVVGVVTAVVYGLFAPVEWIGVAILAPATMLGGFLGAKLARKLPQWVLRAFIVTFGLVIGVYLLVT